MKKIIGLLVLILIGAGVAFYYVNKKAPLGKEEELIFADASTVWWTAPTIIAKTKFFKENGLKVKAFDVNTGLASKNAVLSGSADIGLVASTPLAIGATKNEQLLVLGKYVSSKGLLSIISEIDIDNSPCMKNENDEKGDSEECKELAEQLTMVYVPGTISEFYLIRYLEEHKKIGILKTLKKQSLKLAPPAIPSAFGSTVNDRRINVAVIWEPLASEITTPRSKPKNSYTLIKDKPDENLYELALYLVTTPEVWENKRTAVLKFVKAVSQTGKHIEENRDNVRNMLENKYDYPAGWLEERWNRVQFDYDVSSEKIESLILEDARLAKQTKAIDKIPDVKYMLEVLDEVEAYLVNP